MPEFNGESASRVTPKALPLAPENNEFPEEIRQMIVGRYRVLFTIKGRKVHVLNVRTFRGAYISTLEEGKQD